jgi:hypothetical protein
MYIQQLLLQLKVGNPKETNQKGGRRQLGFFAQETIARQYGHRPRDGQVGHVPNQKRGRNQKTGRD